MGLGSQNTYLTYDPYPIAGLCCKFQLSKGKTVGGDALQRPKSASKIYLSIDTFSDLGFEGMAWTVGYVSKCQVANTGIAMKLMGRTNL